MPYFLSIGVSKAEFDDSTPLEMSVYNEAERLRQKRLDVERWNQGFYNYVAFSTVIARTFAKKSKSEYLKEPLSERTATAEVDKGMTEDEKQMERDKLLMALKTMQANFELNHRNDIGAEE